MRTIWVLLFLAASVSSSQGTVYAQDKSALLVLDSKWIKSRQVVENPEPVDTGPAPAVIPANKIRERNARANMPKGAPDPNEGTTDARSSEIERAVQESRHPAAKPVDGFEYHLKVHNTGTSPVEVIFWEYQFADTADPTNVTHRQFLCGVNIKPDKQKDLRGFSALGPNDVVSVGNLGNKPENSYKSTVVINRVEYTDGTIWQRKDWSYAEIRNSLKHLLSTPWEGQTCRSL
jgi:hypothetical protein